MASEIVCVSFKNPDSSETRHQTTVDNVNFTVPLTCSVNVWIQGVNHDLGAAAVQVSNDQWLL